MTMKSKHSWTSPDRRLIVTQALNIEKRQYLIYTYKHRSLADTHLHFSWEKGCQRPPKLNLGHQNFFYLLKFVSRTSFLKECKLQCLRAFITIEPHHKKTNKMICAPSEESNQPGPPPSLIRVFAVRMKKHWVFGCPFSAQ